MNPNKRHNRRLKIITTIMAIIAVLSVLSLDSDSWIPVIALGVSLIYLWLFCIANME